MVRNFLALVGLWTIINFIVSIIPTSFFEIFRTSQAVKNTIEVTNTKIQAETGLQFQVSKKNLSSIVIRKGSLEDEYEGIKMVNELVGEQNSNDECF